MPVWKIATVTTNPGCTLINWAVLEVASGERHLAGYSLDSSEGRTSTAIVEFDFKTLRARTSSGRTYELCGPPGLNSDALYTWERWCRLNEVDGWSDKSLDVLAEHSRTLVGGEAQD
ncbi:hypothetical protein [Roseateles noduli]|uniref:hypothetical protein n=1 Tax=Roseateles noduli TaxID=2052484 RepID=UPI003D65B1A5